MEVNECFRDIVGQKKKKKKKLSRQNGTYAKTLGPKIRVFQLRRNRLKSKGLGLGTAIWTD